MDLIYQVNTKHFKTSKSDLDAAFELIYKPEKQIYSMQFFNEGIYQLNRELGHPQLPSPEERFFIQMHN